MRKEISTQLYRHFDSDGTLLYVGVSLDTLSRLRQHKENAHWFKLIHTVKIDSFATREEALTAERMAIKNENPLYNLSRPFRQQDEKDEEIEEDEEIEASLRDLFHRIVRFNPTYSLKEAANMLGISIEKLKEWIKMKMIGSIVVGEYKDEGEKVVAKVRITGWQLIACIEYLEEQGMYGYDEIAE